MGGASASSKPSGAALTFTPAYARLPRAHQRLSAFAVDSFQHFSMSAFQRLSCNFCFLLSQSQLFPRAFSFSVCQHVSFFEWSVVLESSSAFPLLPWIAFSISVCVEVGTPVARRPPHRSRRAVFPHRALQVNSLSHEPSGLSPAAENPATVGRNSVPSGKAFPSYTSPQCAVSALGNGPASD